MADDGNNPVPEHLRAIRADLRDVRYTMLEHGLRLDRLADTVCRIEHRLDLVD